MADANVSKIGINAAVEAEEAATAATSNDEAAPEEATVVSAEPVAPNISENRVYGVKEYIASNGSVIVVENL